MGIIYESYEIMKSTVHLLALNGEYEVSYGITADGPLNRSYISNGFFCFFGSAKTALYDLSQPSNAFAACETLKIN